jgi:hypothetical protein
LLLRNHRCRVPEHRFGRLTSRRCARLHRRHRPATSSAGRCVGEHGRAAIRARPSWSGHSGSPVLSKQNGIAEADIQATRPPTFTPADRAGSLGDLPS